MDSVRVFDYGGGTLRQATISLKSRRLVGRPDVVRNIRFRDAAEFARSVVGCLQSVPAGQRDVVISFAGPVSEDGRRIVKFTNQGGVSEMNIPISDMVEAPFGGRLRVTWINDGVSGVYAEASSQGALGKVKEGGYVLALIVGNGVGGRMARKEAGGKLTLVPGAFEIGHVRIARDTLDEVQLTPLLLGRKIECGCGIRGDLERGARPCFETLVRGPALQDLFRRFFACCAVSAASSVGAPPLQKRIDRFFPAVPLTPQEVKTNPLVRAVLRRVRTDAALRKLTKNWPALRVVAHCVTNQDVEAVQSATKNREPLSRAMLSRVGRLFACRLDLLQGRFDKPIALALIGGVGCNMGPHLIPHIEAGIRRITATHQRSAWVKGPTLAVGRFPADETNLYGSFYYWLSHFGSGEG
ncbi:MAG: ROK family protein [Verrucomicrobiae bacterium]|nr:ROK family protein [Verrucomicrobiae bacterium]